MESAVQKQKAKGDCFFVLLVFFLLLRTKRWALFVFVFIFPPALL